jgi:transcriptional regulator with XRE-family HTH domain
MDTKERLLQLIDALGISKSEFERNCGLSNGYLNSIRNGIGSKGLALILASYPQVNKTWLIFGEGEMFGGEQESPSEIPHDRDPLGGDNNTQVIGNGNHINNPTTLDKAIDEIAAQRMVVQKSQEQIDRLLSIIENMNNK